MMGSSTKLLLVLFALLLLTGCGNGEATVKMVCKADPAEGCVDGDCFELETDQTRIWRLDWKGGMFSKSPKNFELRVEDLADPGLLRSETVEINDGDVVEWIIEHDSIDNQATVIIVCSGLAIRGCVNDECYTINSGASRTYHVDWTGGFYGNPPASIRLYAEDLVDPQYHGSETIELKDGQTYEWTITNKDLGK